MSYLTEATLQYDFVANFKFPRLTDKEQANRCKLNWVGHVNPLSAKLTKWPNTLKQFVGNLQTNCLSVFGHFLGLALKGLTNSKLSKQKAQNLKQDLSENL